jgi:Ser/Thr protein kinase RdoA (MazF antagonist)
MIPPEWLVHGLGKELAEPDWPPLTDEEVRGVLGCYEQPGADVAVTWRSPRPMSAAALVRHHGGTVFVKRHDQRVRTAAQLEVEHTFAGHLHSHGQAVPTFLRTRSGATVVCHGKWVYEVQQTAAGLDLYRDRPSWTPFTSLGHAWAAGAALARFHRAACDFPLAPRPVAVLTNSCCVTTAHDPGAEIERLLEERPGLARYLEQRPWRNDLDPHLQAVKRVAPLLERLTPQWGHGDWHPSNLTWTTPGSDAEVAAVFDLGLANSTTSVHDLAVALERCTIDWLELPGTHADLNAVDALLEGYESVRPLNAAEAKALPELLPVIQLEFALSEIEYFADVVRSPTNADVAYTSYLIGHTTWFRSAAGSTLLEHLRRRAAS